jgi:hypothetical protein
VTSVATPICYSCAHLNEGEGMTCTAFPDGIPDEILNSEADHRLPYPGDNGIQFAQSPTAPEPDNTPFGEEP